MRALHSIFAAAAASITLLTSAAATAAPGDPVFETCPEASDVGDNVACYPVTFLSKTKVHPDGIPIIGYLFVPTDAPAEPLPAIVFAHGSGSLYSNGNHNAGLNSKHVQWVREYTGERSIVTFHVSGFHSRYLLPDTPGDQRIFDIETIPDGFVGGDDYRATSFMGSRDAAARIDVDFDPNPISEHDMWKDSDNGPAGISEITERSYDNDAAWDFLAGIRKGRFIENSRNKDASKPTLGTPVTGIGFISEIVAGGLVVDHERIFFSGTSHGGQTAMAVAHAPRALADDSPMNVDLPAGFNKERYAGFFDYYGGCGLYGAYGGDNFDPSDPLNPKKNSAWRPYGPFLMLHGENDPIWKDEDTGTTRGDWFAGECYRRIAAAKADPVFDELLEAVVYKGAHHSFDGVSPGGFGPGDTSGEEDYDEWVAKIHANERMTLGLIDAVGEIVSARRNNLTVPTLVSLGFNTHNPYFSTFPLVPSLPPRVDYAASLSGTDGIIVREDKDEYKNNTASYIVANDPTGVHDFTCTLEDAPPEVSTSKVVKSFGPGCEIVYQLKDAQLGDIETTPLSFSVRIATPLGITFVPVELHGTGTGAVREYHRQAYSIVSPATDLYSDINGGAFTTDANAFVWSWQPALDERFRTVFDKTLAEGTWALTGSLISGNAPDAPLNVNPDIKGHGGDRFRLDTRLETASVEQVRFSDFDRGIKLGTGAGILLPALDFGSRFTNLMPVDVSTPPPVGEFPDDTVPPASGRPGNGEPGSNGSTGGNRNNSGGGGALFWLLPIAWFARRR